MTSNIEHRKERTLVIVKPDGIQRSLIGEVIGRYERIGLKLVAMKMLTPTPELVENHYNSDPNWLRNVGEKAIKNRPTAVEEAGSDDPLEVGKDILRRLVSYFTSGPVIAMVWQGPHAVDVVRKVTGTTEPRTSDVGTIRGDFMLDSYELSVKDNRSIRNLVHASGSIDEAEIEISHWFSADEFQDYLIVQEQILYS